MKKIGPEESEVAGFTLRDGKLAVDRDACARINWLASEALTHVGVDEKSGGWERLYRDPADGRYWLLSYPYGEMQGGGPPLLRHVPLTGREAAEKYVSPAKWEEHVERFMRERGIRPAPPK